MSTVPRAMRVPSSPPESRADASTVNFSILAALGGVTKVAGSASLSDSFSGGGTKTNVTAIRDTAVTPIANQMDSK